MKKNVPAFLRAILILPLWFGFTGKLILPPAAAQTLTTIVTNGPASNRVNLVFFSEGYTSAQLGQFLTDTTNVTKAFFSVQPYAEYSNYFNVFAISVASAQSGSDDPAQELTVNTYFNSSYDDSEHIITIPPNPYDANYNNGQGKIDALLRTFLPNTNNDLRAMLVNSLIPGGSDNYGKVAISAIGEANYILVHESGHTLGNLGDEYTDPYPGFPDTEEPNTTTQTNIALIKWRAWITNGTPIPTPQTQQYANTVGLFQGAHYHATGWYRPTLNSRMQSVEDSVHGFGPVNQEALVLAIYRKMRPLDGHSPATNNFSVASAQMLTFNVSLVKPGAHALDIQWLTNGVVVPGATNAILNVWPAQLGNGVQKIEADISDGTSFVRTDTQNVLKQTNVWTMNVTLPSVQIDSPEWQANGDLIFRITGDAPDGVAIQASTNLSTWVTFQTNALNGSFFYTNFGAFTSAPACFYRAKTPP